MAPPLPLLLLVPPLTASITPELLITIWVSEGDQNRSATAAAARARLAVMSPTARPTHKRDKQRASVSGTVSSPTSGSATIGPAP